MDAESSNVQVCRDVEIFVARARRENYVREEVKARKFDYEKCLAWKFLWLFKYSEALFIVWLIRMWGFFWFYIRSLTYRWNKIQWWWWCNVYQTNWCHKRHKLCIYWNAERHEINLNATWILQSNLAHSFFVYTDSAAISRECHFWRWEKCNKNWLKFIYFILPLSLTRIAQNAVIDKRFIIRSCAWQFMQFSRLDFFIKIVSFVNASRDNSDACVVPHRATNLHFSLSSTVCAFYWMNL